jgi:hypothetical protein
MTMITNSSSVPVLIIVTRKEKMDMHREQVTSPANLMIAIMNRILPGEYR